MLPELEIDIEDAEITEEITETSNTCRVDFKDNILFGSTDGIDALKQAVYTILNTERYAYLIHSDNFGIEISDLIGQDMDYVESEIKNRIKEALEADDRIESVDEFKFERSGRKLAVSFVINSNLGSFDYDYESEV